jgi:formylmethanofuran dehydrogenase subunit E-like metal-binding protein
MSAGYLCLKIWEMGKIQICIVHNWGTMHVDNRHSQVYLANTGSNQHAKNLQMFLKDQNGYWRFPQKGRTAEYWFEL